MRDARHGSDSEKSVASEAVHAINRGGNCIPDVNFSPTGMEDLQKRKRRQTTKRRQAKSRYLATLKSYVRNRSRPEGSIAEGYIAEECLTFCSLYLGDNVETKFNWKTRNDSSEGVNSGLPIFLNPGRPLGKAEMGSLDDETLAKAHLYVLFNCDDVAPYINQHYDIVRRENPRRHIRQLKQIHNATFASWFENHVKMVSRARSSGENMIEQSNVQTDPLQFDGINSGQSNPATGELDLTTLALAGIADCELLFTYFIKIKSKKYRAELGHEPSRMDMFIECHSKKDENRTPSTVEAANYMAQMHEKKEKLSEGSQDLSAENDILSQVVGKDKYGRVRMYGLGVSQSDVWGQIPSRKQSQRIAMEWKENCEQMEERFNNRIDELKSMFLRHRGREES
ncbi:hypothetical protein RJ640_026589 [Escallonia rubra]|uniref:DUF4218 domain-containing protein n=1 Tax=Escallonia rubra TaxID=112253 RepID=A0AA88U066_9ASTE|nr:hypothetical protein RJ640_026589 [Escallonia rubra]